MVDRAGGRHGVDADRMSQEGNEDEIGGWLDRLEDAEFAEGDDRIGAGVLEPPISGSDVPELCRLLGTDDRPAIRRRAAMALGRLAPTEGYDPTRVYDGLRRAILSDDSAAVRAAAIGALYRHDPSRLDRLGERMATAIEDGDTEDDAVNYFEKRLTADRPEFRLLAAAAMGTIGEPRVCSALKTGIDDPDQRVRVRAVKAYGRIGNEVSVEPLERLLTDPEPAVRRAAATALSEIGTQDALEALFVAAESDDEHLRRIAVVTLHRLDRPRTAAVLTEAVRDRSMAVRQRAIVSLVELYLEGSAVSPSEIRDRLLKGTTRSAAIELAELLSAVVNGELDQGRQRTVVEREAAWLLGEAADIEAAAAESGEEIRCLLVDALGHSEEIVAEIAAAYLRRFEGEKLEAKLREVSNDSDADSAARTRAESVLDSIKRSVASELRESAIEYTYVRRPSDYTDRHDR